MAAALTSALLLALQAASVGDAHGSFEHFPVFVWRQDFQDHPIPDELVLPFGGVNVEGADEASNMRERGLEFYVGHAPGREALHLDRADPWYAHLWERWYETREPSLLVRRPCLSAPETRVSLRATLARALAARDGETGLAVSLGDEVSLTPHGDPLDLCTSDTCLAAWRERVGDDRPPPSTDDVRRAYAEGEFAGLGDWLERRRERQDLILAVLADLASVVRAKGAPVALWGVSGQTAFGGVSVPRVLPLLDWLEPYSDTYARELAFTLRAPEQRLSATLFPRGDDPSGGAPRLWEHVVRGGDGAIIWSDRRLAESPLEREHLARAVADVRALRERIGAWRPLTGGVALVDCPDSVAVSFLVDALGDGPTWPKRFAGWQSEHGSRERAVNAWLRALEDEGLLPGALPIDRVCRDWLTRFRALVLVDQRVLSPDSEARLAEWLAAGGMLVVQGEFARFDERGRERASPLGAWREAFAERVLASDAAAAVTARSLSARLALPSLPFRIEVTADATSDPAPAQPRWLVARSPTASVQRFALWLRAAPGNDETTLQLRLDLAAGAPPGSELILLHPSPQAQRVQGGALTVELGVGGAVFVELRAP